MKRALSLFLALLLLGALAGCSGPKEVAFSRNGLTLTLPSYFADKAGEDYAQDVDFLCAYGTMGFLGIREERSAFPEGYQNMGLVPYGKFVILGNGLTCQLEEKEGFYTFSYTKETEEGNFTYVAIVLECADAYWTVQGYCLSQFFEENQALLWRYLKTAQVR